MEMMGDNEPETALQTTSAVEVSAIGTKYLD